MCYTITYPSYLLRVSLYPFVLTRLLSGGNIKGNIVIELWPKLMGKVNHKYKLTSLYMVYRVELTELNNASQRERHYESIEHQL